MKLNLPVIILNSTVLMPESIIRFEFDDEISKNVIDESELFHDNKLFVVTNFSIDQNININELPSIGTIAKITSKLQLPNGKTRVVLKGIERAIVLSYLDIDKDSIESILSTIPNQEIDENTKNAFIRKLYSELDDYIKKVPYMSDSFLSSISEESNLSKITDVIANNLSLDNEKIMSYLIETNAMKRVEMLLEDMYKGLQLFNIESNLEGRVKKELDEEQKNLYLKEKIRLLKQELGELSPKQEEIEQLKEKVEKINASEDIKNKILYEIDRYEKMSDFAPEMNSVKSYIDYMLDLPWQIYTTDIDDLNQVKDSLDKTHYGLDDVKYRIIEYLAVKKLSNNVNAPILCLVGPSGVGKTTLAHSIAKSIGRNFVKISMGGVDDEAFIKGHTRTYLGSAPGKIIDGIKRAKSSNPLFLIDEIDKMSNNYKGDPMSALLDVFDSTQNKYFKDNYIEEEYDLSKVLFITTANDINLIPNALKDRLEIININGYTELEKLSIAKKYLIPTISNDYNIKNIKISDDDILEIIRFYTKESGVRELERLLLKIIRKIITDKIMSNQKLNITIKNIKNYLGKRIYENEVISGEIGLVNGLAYTNFGGDIVPIEANYYDGSGNLTFTGSMGDMMLESAKVALSYIKSNYKKFNIDYELFKRDIHINIPNIAIKKEGPSAGVAITTCLISTLSNLKVSNKIAMTGEITLRGNILGVGGIKEKIIGAYINNIETIFIPYSNIGDLDDIPDEIKDKITFIPVKKYDEIYEVLRRDSEIQWN